MKKITKEKLKSSAKKIFAFILNPRFVLCFGMAWIITNGWAYIAFALGTFLQITWLAAIAAAYLAFLWIPGTPEKIVTLAISIFLLKRLFPNDEKTLGVLKRMRERVITAVRLKKKEHAEKKKDKKDKK